MEIYIYIIYIYILEMLIPAIPAIPHWQVLWSFSNLGGVPGKDSPSLSEALVALWLNAMGPWSLENYRRDHFSYKSQEHVIPRKGFERPYSVRITLLCTGMYWLFVGQR